MVTAVWIVTLFGWALWSLGAWGLHALLSLDATRLADLKPWIDQWPERLPHAGVIDAWLPGWREVLKFGVDLTQSALDWIGSAAPVIVWVTWATGSLMMLGLAVAATWGIRSLSRRAQHFATTGSAAPGNR